MYSAVFRFRLNAGGLEFKSCLYKFIANFRLFTGFKLTQNTFLMSLYDQNKYSRVLTTPAVRLSPRQRRCCDRALALPFLVILVFPLPHLFKSVWLTLSDAPFHCQLGFRSVPHKMRANSHFWKFGLHFLRSLAGFPVVFVIPAHLFPLLS